MKLLSLTLCVTAALLQLSAAEDTTNETNYSCPEDGLVCSDGTVAKRVGKDCHWQDCPTTPNTNAEGENTSGFSFRAIDN